MRSYEGCLFHTQQTHLPAQALQTIHLTWPFIVWGLDMVGPLRKAPGDFTHLLVAIDKFSKWIEARPICSVRSEEVVEFFTNIIYHFRISNAIITDNGSNFTGKKFLCFCDDNNIQLDWVAVSHLRTNKQVGRANGMTLQGLKSRILKRLEKFKARCEGPIRQLERGRGVNGSR
jgi:hypothetical protein